MGKHKWLLVIPISLILLQSCYGQITANINTNSGTTSWPMFHQDLERSGYVTGDISGAAARSFWTFRTWKAVKSSPAVANGCVLVGSRDWRIYCLDSSSGRQLWNYSTGNEVNSSPAIHSGSVIVGSDDGYVYCLNISGGALLWRREIGGQVRSCPAVVDDHVYVGSGDRGVFCLDASNGTIIWSYWTSNRVHSSPALSNGVVYIAADDFFVYALNASTGSEIWRCHTGATLSSPCVSNGYVYIGSTDGYVCALNTSTGAKMWESSTGGSSVYSSPAVAYGRIYIGSDDNSVYCLNASNGENLWRSPTGYWVRSSPVVADGKVYVGSEDFGIYCFDAFAGAKEWSYSTGSSVDSSPAIVGGVLYFGSCDFNVYAFALDGIRGEPLPSQIGNSLPLTTIIFDGIALVVAAGIILALVKFLSSRKSREKAADGINGSSLKRWLSSHVDVLCILIIACFSAIFFLDLGIGPLWATDEQTYSQWAYHMFKTGDYLTPWTFGQLEIGIGKPPLFMWLMSLAYQIFGVNNFASRFWSPVFAVLSLVLVFYLGKKLYNSFVGLLSALLLGTFTTFYLFARHAMTDVTFVFFLLGSVYFSVLNEKGDGSKKYAALAGLFFGLAFLTKQLQAFLIPLVLVLYYVVTKRSLKFFFTKRFALFWQVWALVVSPWLIYMILRFGPDFWQTHFFFSGFTRTVSPIEGHVEGYLYYFNYLITKENLILILILPFAAGLCFFNALIKRSQENTLVFGWMTTVLVFFTIAQTKLFWYILPAFPAFAMAISNLIFQLSEKLPVSLRWFYRNINAKAKDNAFLKHFVSLGSFVFIVIVGKNWKRHFKSVF